MKTTLSLILLTLLCWNAYSQSSANASGIAVQGIARDANNTARSNATVNLKFTIYFINSSNVPEEIYSETKSLQTDAFGVFSHVIDPGAVNNSKFGSNLAYLKIEEGQNLISDEKLKHVPYAISANNGVPTGSIMPYIGTTAPPGWVICDGQNLTNIPGSEPLRILLGTNNAPDLQGMFLRGTGTSPVNQQAGPALKQTQGDLLKSHSHEAGTLKTANDGAHQHKLPHNGVGGNITRSINWTGVVYQTEEYVGLYSAVDGAHSHDVEGSTNESGGAETRPVSYGINYIIKL